MLRVYSPANVVEAHMLVHLLAQAGVQAHIHGEALEGAVGELPAGNLIQLMVANEDYERARPLILNWERTSAAHDVDERPKYRFPLFVAISFTTLGLITGFALKSLMAAGAITVLGSQVKYDQNGDDRDDLTYFYRMDQNTAYKYEADANFDGRVDLIVHFDELGMPSLQESDSNFDGQIETQMRSDKGTLLDQKWIEIAMGSRTLLWCSSMGS